MVWLERKKNQSGFTKELWRASQYIKRLPYIRNEGPDLQNSLADVVNNRSDLRKFLLATSDYGRDIQENINTIVADGKFNQAVVRRALDQEK